MPLSNKGWDEAAACSTDSRPQSRCCRVPTESRAQARGDPKMASDEGYGKVSKSAEEVRDEFEEKMHRLRRQYERDLHSFRYEIEEREYRLKAYEDKFNKIKQPPLLYAYVVRKEGPDLDGHQVVVARATELLKVSTGLVDKSQLGVGQYVWVHPQTYAIVEGSAVRNEGVIAKVVDMPDGKLVISVEGDMEKRLIDCDKNVFKKLKPGFQIGVLPPTMEVLDILPNLEVKSLLLGEKPNVTYGEIGGLMEAIERIKDVVVLPYQEAKLFAQISLQAPRGILLYGPPGCGKTLLVKAIATENDMTFFNVSIADVLSKWVGESERIIKEIFRQAHEKKPSLDEMYGGHKEAVDALRRFVLDELYGENKWVKVKLDAEAKEAIKTVKRKDIISGAIIEAIVTTAKKNFVKRVILLKKTERKKEGLTMKDLEMAIDEESKEHAITEMYVYEKRQREVFRTGADPMVG